MRDLQILTECRLKRKATGEHLMHPENKDHGLLSKEHIKQQGKGEARSLPVLSLTPRSCSVQSHHIPNIFTLLLSVIYKFQ